MLVRRVGFPASDRRAGVVAVPAVFARAALAGCRSDPTVAAYLGDRRITVAEVDEIVDRIPQLLNADARVEMRHFAVVRALSAAAKAEGGTVDPRYAPSPVPLIYSVQLSDQSSPPMPFTLFAEPASGVPVEEA